MFSAAWSNRHLPIKTTWGICPATSHKAYKQLVTTVSLGEARTLQAPQSDVSLDIPENCHGIYSMHIQTNLTPDECSADECFISPVVHVSLQKLKTNKADPFVMNLCKLNVPHCLPDGSYWNRVKVQHESHTQPADIEEFTRVQNQPTQGTFEVHNHHISIYTRNFSKFTCTSCGKVTCGTSVLSFLFGRTTTFEALNKTAVDMKMFVGGPLYSLQDFANVSLHDISVFYNCFVLCEDRQRKPLPLSLFQPLIQGMQEIGMSLVEKGGVQIKQKSTDLEASRLTMTISPESPDWGPEASSCFWHEGERAFVKVGETVKRCQCETDLGFMKLTSLQQTDV